MNDNNYNNQENDKGKEEIKFDDMDFENPYAKYFDKDSRDETRYENPYSKQYHGDETRYENPYSKRQHDGFEDFKVKEDPIYAPPIDEAAAKRHFSRLGLGFAIFSVISMAVSLIFQMIVLSVNPELFNSTLFLNLLTPVSLYIFALPVLLIILSGCEAKAPEKKKFGVGSFLLFLIAAFGFMYIGSLIGNSVMELLSDLVGYDYSNGLESIVDADNIWITAIFTVIVAPIGEEFVFRKLVIDRTQKYGAVISIGLSGLMFGLMHANFYQFFYATALGFLLGYIYFHSGKLYLTIAIHAIVNFVGSVVSSLLMPISQELESIDPADTEALMQFIEDNPIGYLGMSIFGYFTMAAMLSAIILPLIFRKKLSFPRGETVISRKRATSVVMLNGGILAMLIFYLLEFGLNLLPI